MKFIERRVDRLWRKADTLVEQADGDIYGAPLELFRRWYRLTELAAELATALMMIEREKGSDR